MAFLSDEAIAAIREWLPERAQVLERLGRKDEPAVFVSKEGNRLSYMPLYYMLAHVVEAAGISGPCHPHKFRHSLATHLMNRGMDIRRVQEVLGHSSITSTQVYTHVAQEQLWKELGQVHPGQRRAGATAKPSAAERRLRVL
jgi:site-specific recombinase XerD